MIESLESILLVDNDDIVNFYCTAILKNHNPDIKIEIFTNGSELIDYVQSPVDREWPIVVFLDFNMDLITGPEFIEWYHANNHQGKMQIFMFSASILPEDIERCMIHEDVLGYYEKPINKNKIREVLKILNQN